MKNKTVVQFKEVEIREYELDLSDNPACWKGSAIAIGWNYKEHMKASVDEYETMRGPFRAATCLVLSRAQREEIVKRSQYSMAEIRKMNLSRTKARDGRTRTMNNLSLFRTLEIIENSKRKLKRVVLGKEKDHELKMIWPEYIFSQSYHESLKPRVKDELRDSSSTLSTIASSIRGERL